MYYWNSRRLCRCGLARVKTHLLNLQDSSPCFDYPNANCISPCCFCMRDKDVGKGVVSLTERNQVGHTPLWTHMRASWSCSLWGRPCSMQCSPRHALCQERQFSLLTQGRAAHETPTVSLSFGCISSMLAQHRPSLCIFSKLPLHHDEPFHQHRGVAVPSSCTTSM